MIGKSHPVVRYVDMWAMPGVHPSNIEFLQQLKTADTNHFTTHMDCVGKVSTYEDGSWKRTHLVGIRTDVWKPSGKELRGALNSMQGRRRSLIKKSIKRSGRLSSKQQTELEQRLADDDVMNLGTGDLVSRRLILKLFRTTSSRTRWVGTLEQMTTSEVHNSIGSKRPLISLVGLLPRVQTVTHLQQNHRTLRIPPVFSGCYEDDGALHNVLLKKRWVALGAHYDLYADGRRLGEIDSRLISFGSDCTLRMRDHALSDDTPFVNLMTLFAASLGYHKAMHRSVRRRVKSALAGESFRNVVEDEELRLRHNGRAAA